MKVLKQRELQHIAFNHSSDIDFKDFMSFFKIYDSKLYSFLVNDTTLESDNHLCIRRNILERTNHESES